MFCQQRKSLKTNLFFIVSCYKIRQKGCVTMTPENVGISSNSIENFIKKLNNLGFAMHSVLMSVDGNICYEAYWKPYNENSLQRMNSVSKSFIGIAIGLLEQEGMVKLTDKLYTYFPEISPDVMPEYVKEVTIEDALTMRTASVDGPHWVKNKLHNRIERYFTENTNHKPGTIFSYDTVGSYLLGVIVERKTGMPFLEYLKEKVLLKTGFSKNSYCIKTPEGYSWGDSGILCTLRDLHTFGQLIANLGKCKGEQLVNKEYMIKATTKQVDTNLTGYPHFKTFGYGYHIWKCTDDGFAFHGMGDQFLFYFPKQKFMFVCTADNQGNNFSKMMIFDAVSEFVKANHFTPIKDNEAAYKSLLEYSTTLELTYMKGMDTTSYEKSINNVTYICDKNPSDIKYVKFSFYGDTGFMEYENKQGKKVFKYGMCKNIFTLFPEEDYFDTTVGIPEKGHKYPCAISAAWVEEQKLCIRVQSIDKHLGGLYIIASFKDDDICIELSSNTNCFFNEYSGFINGKNQA